MTSSSDDFNRTSLGAAWFNPATANHAIVGNQLAPSTLSAAVLIFDTAWDTDDNESEVTIAVVAGAPRVVCRNDRSKNNFYYFYYNGTQFQLGKCVAEVFTNLGSPAVAALVAADRMKIRCAGTTVEGLVNGAVVCSIIDSAITIGKFSGIRSSGSTALRYDDWAGGDYAAASGQTLDLDSIAPPAQPGADVDETGGPQILDVDSAAAPAQPGVDVAGAGQIVTDGLVHHWRFDEGAGSTVADQAGTSDAALTGVAWGNAAVDGSPVAYFDGSTAEAVAPAEAPAAPFTICAVVRPDQGSMKDTRGILYQRDDGATGGGFLLAFSTGTDAGGDEVVFSVRNDAGTTTTITWSPRLLNLKDTWLIILAGLDSDGSMFLRIDRRELTAAGAVYDPSSRDLNIGRTAQTGLANQRLKGRLADVLTYDRYLTDAERTQNFEALRERINGTFSLTDGAPLDPTILTGPYDGIRVDSTEANYKQITSDADHVYIAESVTDGVQQSRAAKLAKSGGSMGPVVQDVQLLATGHDANVGHRGAALAVLPSGTVVAHPQKHDSTWGGLHTTVPGDLSTLTATPEPAAVAGITQLGYHKMWTLGDAAFMSVRGDQAGALIARWNDTSKVWETVGAPLVADNANDDSWYSGQGAMARHTDGTIYLCGQFRGGGAGHPARYALSIMSEDGGDTWADLAGGPVASPIDPDVTSMAFFHSGDYDINRPSVAVSAFGGQIAVAPWRNLLNGDTVMGLWVSTFDPASGDFIRHQLGIAATNWHPMGVTRLRGMVVAVGADPGTRELVAYATLDGRAWVRHVIDAPANWVRGVQVDDRAGEFDNRVRFLTCRTDASDWGPVADVAQSDVYEFDIPDAPGSFPQTVDLGAAEPPAQPGVDVGPGETTLDLDDTDPVSQPGADIVLGDAPPQTLDVATDAAIIQPGVDVASPADPSALRHVRITGTVEPVTTIGGGRAE